MPSGRLAGSSALSRQRRQIDARAPAAAHREPAAGEHQLASIGLQEMGRQAAAPWRAPRRSPSPPPRRPYASSARRHGRRRSSPRACRPARSGSPRIGTPSRSAAIWAKAVSWPWPFDSVPTATDHRAVALEADLGAFVGRAARGFEEAGDADAAQPAARLRPRAPRLEARELGAHDGAVEIVDEAARIDRPCPSRSCAGRTRSGSAGAARPDRGRACARPPRCSAR